MASSIPSHPAALRCSTPGRFAFQWFAIGAVLALVGAGSAAAQATGPAMSPPPMNSYCPVMQNEIIDPKIIIEYAGRRIGLCCDRCKKKFLADPQRYAAVLGISVSADAVARAALPQAAGESTERDTPTRHLLRWFGKFHPASVHLPLGLLNGALVAELLHLLTGRASFRFARRYCLWFGAVGGCFAACLGWFFAGLPDGPESTLLTAHRWLGSAAAIWFIAAATTFEFAERRAAPGPLLLARVMLLVGGAALGITGFLGGALVHGLDHYAW